MKTTKIIFNFSRIADGALEDLALAVAAAITGNAHFPEPSPTVAVLNDSTKAFSDGLALARSRDKVKVAVKNNLRAALERTLRNLANYCTYIAQGDRALLVSSGFLLTADISVPKPLSAPENFTVQLGNHPGEVTVSVNRVTNALAYLLLYRPASTNNTLWTHATNTLPYFSLTGLDALQTYNFRIGVIGTKRQMLYTDIITKVVL